MSTTLDYVKHNHDVTTYDFSKVDKTEICDEIISRCNSAELSARVKSIALVVATAAIAYFAYMAAASLVASYGILGAGITILALVTIFPIVLLAIAPPFIVAAKAMQLWDNANKIGEQGHLATLRKAELISARA